jgi:pilus assembly protein CpaC
VGKNLILGGNASSPRDATQAMQLASGLFQNAEDQGVILNQMSLAGPNQINLQVRIAEVARDSIKQLGFNFDAFGGPSSDFLLGLVTGGVPAFNSVFDVFSAAGEANGFGAKLTQPNLTVDALIDALEEQNLITVLAEPNLTTLTGETASFLAGGEFPIPVPGEDGKVTIEFKAFGVSLSFTPTILDSGRMSVRVRPEVSTISTVNSATVANFIVPSLSTRRSETTVELGSGQSMAIAGLLRNDVRETVSEFPGLADIPILGALFRSTSFQNEETELVIIVTPYLVQPTSDVALLAPTDGLQIPNDLERTVKGSVYEQRSPVIRRAPIDGQSQGLVGPVGFVLD